MFQAFEVNIKSKNRKKIQLPENFIGQVTFKSLISFPSEEVRHLYEQIS